MRVCALLGCLGHLLNLENAIPRLTESLRMILLMVLMIMTMMVMNCLGQYHLKQVEAQTVLCQNARHRLETGHENV